MSAKPNFLIIIADQLNGTLFSDGPAPWLKTPALTKLAERSLRFSNCYTASPLCAPARASLMSGQLPSRTGVYDNAAEFGSDIPTFAHYLRRAGYSTTLSGKMHFVGPDQLHGFEERLTTDIYPADFGWTPDYRKPDERIDWWYHNLGSVTGAGVAEITNQLEYDDEVAYHAKSKLYDLSRGGDDRPWCLTVSFTHPHDPYVARRKYWELYQDCEHLHPSAPSLAYEEMDPHSKRLMDACDWRNFDISKDNIARSRRAYFANISYIDDKIAEIVEVLETTRQAENTVIIFTSDHGDMLGDRGMWFKMSFFEGSARVPMMVYAPDLGAGLITEPVSTLDLLPTLCDLAGIDLDEIGRNFDGESLVPLASGGLRSRSVPMEYAAEGSIAPMVSLREGRYKLIYCEADPAQLFDLENDPCERRNLAADPAHADVLARLTAQMKKRWDLADFDASVRESQARRWIVYEALRNGSYYPWDFQPLQMASERYMRNHMDLNTLETQQRFPRDEAE